MSERVRCDVIEGVGKIVLDRPEVGNAIDEALGAALIAAIDRVAGDGSVRAVLLTATGKMFCAGGDIAMMRTSGARLAEGIERTVGPLGAAVLKLASMPVPVVSALNGPIGGGGIGLALCADLVLAAESMKLRGGYSGIGLTPDLGASYFLTHRAGLVRAKQLLLLNQSLTARECLEWGIVNAVHADDRLGPEAETLVRRLAEGATLSLGRIKRLVDEAPARSLEAQLAVEREYMVESARTEDAREGVAAFIEKRAPRFVGR